MNKTETLIRITEVFAVLSEGMEDDSYDETVDTRLNSKLEEVSALLETLINELQVEIEEENIVNIDRINQLQQVANDNEDNRESLFSNDF